MMPMQYLCEQRDERDPLVLQILQYHKQGDNILQQFSLGRYAANLSDVNEIHWEVGPTGTSTAYVRQASVSFHTSATPSSICLLAS